jgi:predicted DCC family thiol-disulfide oxidoreductase YuxK
MVASYLSFVKLPDIRNFGKWLSRTVGLKPLKLVYDGECDFCRSVLLIVHFLDVLRLVRFLDYHNPEELAQAGGVSAADAEQAAIAVDDRGRLYRGFYAFRQICRRVPLLAPLTVVTYIPGIPALGERAYRWVAENRSHLPVAGRYRIQTR